MDCVVSDEYHMLGSDHVKQSIRVGYLDRSRNEHISISFSIDIWFFFYRLYYMFAFNV